MRYRGQNWELEVPASRERLGVETVSASFDRDHERLYRFQMPEHEHEVINLRVAVAGPLQRGAARTPRRERSHAAQPRGERPVLDDTTRQFVDTAIVEEFDTTVVVPSGWSAVADNHGNLILTRAHA